MFLEAHNRWPYLLSLGGQFNSWGSVEGRLYTVPFVPCLSLELWECYLLKVSIKYRINTALHVLVTRNLNNGVWLSEPERESPSATQMARYKVCPCHAKISQVLLMDWERPSGIDKVVPRHKLCIPTCRTNWIFTGSTQESWVWQCSERACFKGRAPRIRPLGIWDRAIDLSSAQETVF